MGRGFESLRAHFIILIIKIWWVWRSWLARQIVALEAEGSSPSTHPKVSWNPRFLPRVIHDSVMVHSQAVRHRTLTPALVGSNPTGPAFPIFGNLNGWATSSGGRALDF